MSSQQPTYLRGFVKQVTPEYITIWKLRQGGPPLEKQLTLSAIKIPKLARQKAPTSDNETRDEPFAWEAREFLRKKIVGKEVFFTAEKPATATGPANREYGIVIVGNDTETGENVGNSLVFEGLASVRDTVRNNALFKHLGELEDQAKHHRRGIWSDDLSKHIRDVKWSVEGDPAQFVNKFRQKPLKAVIEFVRDGSTIRATVLPNALDSAYYSILVNIAGIKCPSIRDTETDLAREAQFFVERLLLQRDVEIILQSVNNNNFVGSIIHPQGNIAELLLKQGFAKTVSWSLNAMHSGASVLKDAEKYAKANKLKIWKDYQSNATVLPEKEREFHATVTEVVNGDTLLIKKSNGDNIKIFLASIRAPATKNPTPASPDTPLPPRPDGFRALYDIPWMFEAREFLRKKLVGKRVNIIVDYIQPARDRPEKKCCTVIVGGENIAEALVANGLATVVRHRQDDDQRSSHYDKLEIAEAAAAKANLGVHAKKDIPTHRVPNKSGDVTKAKQFLPFLQRAKKTEALVEFVASGSRLRLYIPKETCLITFLLGGINCPRAGRSVPNSNAPQLAEPFGDEALQYTKDKCLQREVTVLVEGADKAGNFIGWLWVDNTNLSVALVEKGFASMHFSAEQSEYAREIKAAEDNAKKIRLGIWKDYVEEVKVHQEGEATVQERKVKYESVVVTEVTKDGHFYTQSSEQGPKLVALMEKIHKEFTSNPPLPGSFVPKRGELCAARFTQDDQWYRAKVEKLQGSNATVLYVDYGNREVLNISRLASLPAGFGGDKPYATEYSLACITFPTDEDYRVEAIRALQEDIINRSLFLNIEIRGGVPAATLSRAADSNSDIGRGLIEEGLLLVDNVRDRRLSELIQSYREAQSRAKANRVNLWQHGDITDDDAKEFGVSR